jgi:hypothetical protein
MQGTGRIKRYPRDPSSLPVHRRARNVRPMTDTPDATAFTVLATRTVSDKTVRDGRLEIGDRPGAMLGTVAGLAAALKGTVVPAQVGRFDCDCRDEHRHYYVESDVFKRLPIGTVVALRFDAEHGRIIVEPQR